MPRTPSAPALTIDALRSGLSGGSFGKGSTAEQGEASALMEAIERYSGIFQGDEIRLTRRFADFPPGDAILPNDVLLFSDAQYQAEELQIRMIHPTPDRFDPSAKVEWSPARAARPKPDIFPPACCISSMAVPTRFTPIPPAAPPVIRSRRPSSRASSNWWSAI